MNRRGFLAGLLASAVVPALPLVDSISIGESSEYLTLAEWARRMPPGQLKDIIGLLIEVPEFDGDISWREV